MKKITLIVLAGGSAIVAALASLFLLASPSPTPIVMRGSMFVSDAGRSHGGFEYNAEWNVTLAIQGEQGTLKMTLSVGLGDALERHEYRIADFDRKPNELKMKVDGRPVTLIWVEEDRIWARSYDRHYIASWGSDAPSEEMRGSISPTIFPGLIDFWYVELRLRP